MITVELDNFSLREICRSGQCFRMHETAENNTYELIRTMDAILKR